MPDSGTMTVSRSSRSLPGHPGCSSIVIVYNFSPGISVRTISVFCKISSMFVVIL